MTHLSCSVGHFCSSYASLSRILFAFSLIFFNLAHITEATFWSIDAGYLGKNYTTSTPPVVWVSDAPFVRAGKISQIYDVPNIENGKALRTLRFFPNGTKNCFEIPVSMPGRYLVRMLFWYSNYNAQGNPPVFNVSIGITNTGTIDLTPGVSVVSEYIVNVFNTSSTTPPLLKICFIRILHDPIINSLEIRSLPNNSYDSATFNNDVLRLTYRMATGSEDSNKPSFRYPLDPLDRVWIVDFKNPNYGVSYTISPLYQGTNDTTKDVAGLSTNEGNPNYVPKFVLQTNRQAQDGPSDLNYTFFDLDFPHLYQVYMYFVELETEPIIAGSRVFNISFNDETVKSGFDVFAAAGQRKYRAVTLSYPLQLNNSTFFLRLSPNSFSTFQSPLISGLEIYQTCSAPLAVSADQVNALQIFSDTLDDKDALVDWTGDPCHPVQWTGVVCDISQLSNNIVEIDLSGLGITGQISSSLGLLPYLKKLNLSNNGLYGQIPETLGNFDGLMSISLQNNDLSGSIPSTLLNIQSLRVFNAANNSLSGNVPFKSNDLQIITVTGNDDLCSTTLQFGLPNCTNITAPSLPPGTYVPFSPTPPPPPVKKRFYVTTVVSIVIVLVGFLGVIVLCILRSKKFPEGLEPSKDVEEGINKASGQQNGGAMPHPFLPQFSTLNGIVEMNRARQFSIEELKKATNDFSPSNQIGSGGFGAVFKGILANGHAVALKKRLKSSLQGHKEFYTEIELLSRVHHRNVVPLIGFCQDQGEEILVYQFMARGNVKDLLYDLDAKPLGKLPWKTRLSIALGAAQGIEYLHSGSNPAIIHRDIKTGNILLDENYNPYVADLGLSKFTVDETNSYINTAVRGTPGYVDPEYAYNQRLTEKSDVYSFGVVLLELVTGKPPIVDGRMLIRDWALPIMQGRVKRRDGTVTTFNDLADPTITKEFNVQALAIVAECGVICTEPNSVNRLPMSRIIDQLKGACILEGLLDPNGAMIHQPKLPVLNEDDEIEEEYDSSM